MALGSLYIILLKVVTFPCLYYYVNCFNCRTKLNYANGRKLLDLNKLSPIGLLPGVSFTWSCCQSHGITDGVR